MMKEEEKIQILHSFYISAIRREAQSTNSSLRASNFADECFDRFMQKVNKIKQGK